MLIRGTKISTVDYIHAKRITNEGIKKEFLAILQKNIDVIVVPTTIISAPRFNELTVIELGDTILQTRGALLRLL
jgi:Asp-tRNA(Asn)/Glu-tRNA(Gln) amidotransferase A subunit family amidase